MLEIEWKFNLSNGKVEIVKSHFSISFPLFVILNNDYIIIIMGMKGMN